MQFGFSHAAFRDRYPDTPLHQLAVAGSWPYASLRDLAYDEEFRGVVLISFTPDVIMSFRRQDQEPNVYHYRNKWNIDVWLNFLASSFAERFMVTRHQNYGVNKIFRNLVNNGKLPEAVSYLETKFDREINADYSEVDVLAHRMRRLDDAKSLYDDLYPVSQELWRADLDDFLDLARAIHDRGGCVVAIRFHSQGELYDYEQRLFPNQDFWSALGAIPFLGTVQSEDLDITDRINLPDHQHVDVADKYQFTDALLTEIGKPIAQIDSQNCVLGQ